MDSNNPQTEHHIDVISKERAVAFAFWLRRKTYYNTAVGEVLWYDNDEPIPEFDECYDIFKSETEK